MQMFVPHVYDFLTLASLLSKELKEMKLVLLFTFVHLTTSRKCSEDTISSTTGIYILYNEVAFACY